MSDLITNLFEALRGNPALDHGIHEYALISRISRHVGYCTVFKLTMYCSRRKCTYIVDK